MSCKKKCCPKCDCKFDKHDRPKCDCEKPKKDDCEPEPKCCQCKDGRDGRDGPPGPRGPAGPAGPTGSTGPAGESPEPCIANAFNTDQRTVPNGVDVSFEFQGPESGSITGPVVNGTTFTIGETGIYSFNYTLKILQPELETTAIFGLVVSNTPIPGTIFASTVGGSVIVGMGAVNLTVGDQVTLRNLSAIPFNLNGSLEADGVVNAELTLECVDTTA